MRRVNPIFGEKLRYHTVRLQSFPALAGGLKRALEQLGGSPREHRSDSLSAAYQNLSAGASEDFTQRYPAFCSHYGLKATRNHRGVSHENGSIESAHGHLKTRMEQRRLLRGSFDFTSIEVYQQELDEVVESMNVGRAVRFEEERTHLRPLPPFAGIDYHELMVRVTTASTITVALTVYSVPSRLIGSRLKVHLYDDRLIAWLGCDEVFRHRRIRPEVVKRRARCIDYRHLIGSLKRKPGAFARSLFRNEMLPNDDYRAVWAQCMIPKLPERCATEFRIGWGEFAATR